MKLGVTKMAKSLLKKAKKAVKSAKKEAKSHASEVKEAVKATSSSAKSHIESFAHSRRDCAVVWGMIKDGNHSDDEIREIVKDKGFDTLLGEI